MKSFMEKKKLRLWPPLQLTSYLRLHLSKLCSAQTCAHSQPSRSPGLYNEMKVLFLRIPTFLICFCVPVFWLKCWCDAIKVGSIEKAPAVSRLLLKSWCLRDAE